MLTIKNIRPAPLWLLALLLASIVLMTVLGTWIVPRRFWLALHRPTYGLVNLAYLTYTLLVIVGVLLVAGRRRPAEIGLELRKLPAGLLYTALVWLGLQLVMLGWYFAFGRSIGIAREWTDPGAVRLAGVFVGHLFGNALNEEVVYRGFLLTQLVLLFRSRWPHRPGMACLVAIALESAIFSTMHVPDRLLRGVYTSAAAVAFDQLDLFFKAIAYALVFWRTGNLFFAVGLHGVSNLPTTILAWHDLGPVTNTDPIVYSLGIVIAFAGPRGREKSTGVELL